MKELPTSISLGLKRKQIPVVIEDENGNSTNWELRELTAKARDEYMELLNKRQRFDSNGKVAGMTSVKGLHSELLTRSLFRNGGDNGGKFVTEKEIEAWPSSAVQQLFDAASELNGLRGEVKEPDSKNE